VALPAATRYPPLEGRLVLRSLVLDRAFDLLIADLEKKNQLWAEKAYGRDHVERARHFRQEVDALPGRARPGRGRERRTRERRRRERRTCGRHDPRATAALRRTSRRRSGALIGLGFRGAAARRAVADVAERHAGEAERLSEQQVLVEAIQRIDGRGSVPLPRGSAIGGLHFLRRGAT
jgi:hypothetical protein